MVMWGWGGVKMRVCPASQKLQFQEGALYIQSLFHYCPLPLVLGVVLQRGVVSLPLFFLPPLSRCWAADGEQVSKCWVLWCGPPPVVWGRCTPTQRGTWPPRRTLGDPLHPPYRGTPPLRLIPGDLAHRAYRPEPHHQHQKDLCGGGDQFCTITYLYFKKLGIHNQINTWIY